MASYKVRGKSNQIQQGIIEIFQEEKPRLSVRRIFYAAEVKGLVSKDLNGYRKICYQLKQMRLRGIIPYGWISDNTRWQIKPTSFDSINDAFNFWQESYRKDLWASQPVYVEVWIEKDSLAGSISPITQKYNVPLMVARGFSSMTFAYDAAEEIKAVGKPTYIYHFGDFDPSGVSAAYKIKEELEKHGAEIHFERMAITEEQISAYSLPSRETKKSDPRARKWGNKLSVELEALPTPILRNLVEICIHRHIEPYAWTQTELIERGEQETLESFIQNFVHIQNFGQGAGDV